MADVNDASVLPADSCAEAECCQTAVLRYNIEGMHLCAPLNEKWAAEP
ncbi:hypothetical protein [Ruminococcus sp. YRD2003]